MNLLSRAIFAVAACALALGGGAVQAQTPPTYVSPSGTNLPAGVVSIFGLDSVTGLKCLIGTSSTCLVPTTPASGGGIASSVNITQIGSVAVDPTAPSLVTLPTLEDAIGTYLSAGANRLVNTGSVYHTTRPTYADGDQAQFWFDNRSNLAVRLCTTQSTTCLSLDASGNVPTAPKATASTTDRSGTITAGGAAQQVMAANTSRRSFYAFNPDVAETLWCSVTTPTPTANGQGAFPIAPLAGFGMETSPTTSALYCIAATTGHIFTAWESN